LLNQVKMMKTSKGKTLISFPNYNRKVGRMRFQPLKITFEMQSPIAVTDYIHFDSLIWHSALQDQLGEAFWNQTGREHYNIKIPLEERVQTLTLSKPGKLHGFTLRKKYYAASVGLYEDGYIEDVQSWRKRSDFPDGVGKIDIRRGQFKAYNTPLTVIYTPTVAFYAVGNAAEILRLLTTHITHIGKKRAQGYGKIKQITVEPIKEDRSLIWQGKLQRPIPVMGCPLKFEDPIIMYYAWRPPYWRLSSLTECYMPGSRTRETQKRI